MYTLIIWTTLCTGFDLNCETGHWLEMETKYGARVTCEKALEAWKASSTEHRGACLYKEKDHQ